MKEVLDLIDRCKWDKKIYSTTKKVRELHNQELEWLKEEIKKLGV